ncbi:jg4841 [Pararge aegeria aegeria]|uniref:Jg4841 protein n=2 Tax=Pararge aegeria TaxID=116150 RepID=A0A8S4QJH4_9NEOP|nr:jg4841 [Pararge aegeria aegeria]
MDIEMGSIDLLDDELLCTICYAEFLDKEDLDIHVNQLHLTEARKNRFCSICTVIFPDINEYALHLRNHHILSLKCYHMQEHFYKDSLKQLEVSKQCPKCKQPFNTNSLKSHLKNCAGLTCVLCDLPFSSVNDFTTHRLAEHGSWTLSLKVCIYCRRTMAGAKAMEKHIERVHKNDKHLYKYHCTDCNRLFKHPKLLFAHFYSKHKDLNPYTCKICDQKFRLRKNFTLHIKLTHKSVGFVEFDENFQVFFTDKKSDKQSNNSHKVLEKSVDENNEEDETDYEINQKCEDSDSLCEDRCKIEIENLNNKCNEYTAEKPKEESCVLSVEVKTEHLDDEKTKNKQFRIVEVNVNETDNVANDNFTKEETGDFTTDCEGIEKPIENPVKKPVLKRKRKASVKAKIQYANDDVSSDDSDIPLKLIRAKTLQKTKKRKFSRMPLNKPSKTKNFICNTCNRNCFTFQNYHRHIAFHIKRGTKTCIKCYAKFDSIKKLNEHIKKEHSTSKLTETLKKLLEKRKTTDANTKETLDEEATLSSAQKFRNTIKKVKVERSTSKVTMTLVDKDKISVKKYLENFTPDSNEVKINMLNNIPSDKTSVRRLRQLIKLTKFTPEPTTNKSEVVSLKMPVKFTDDLNEKCQVSIKLVSDYVAPTMRFDNQIECLTGDNYINAYDNCDTYDSFEAETGAENKEVIPEMAQEVMLVGTEELNNVHTMDLKNLPAWHDVRIAHLAPEAPYFKITNVNTLGPKTEEDIAPPDNITLPNGKKLVSVNPFAHLLDKNKIDELKKGKKKKCGYKPKLKNVAEAITKAMEKLDKTPVRDKKRF